MSIIAQVKERENIAEYILYMWQMEDLVRGCHFDLDQMMISLFRSKEIDDATKSEYKQWFATLIDQMKSAGKTVTGHIPKVTDYMESLEELHQALLIAFQDKKYIEKFNMAAPDIAALRQRSGDDQMPIVHLCLTGLYGFLILKMKQSEISEETHAAMKNIGQMMAMLSAAFKRLQQGELRLPQQLNN